MTKNLTTIAICAGIVALSWAFYAYAGEYAISIILTIIFVSMLVRPVSSKFSNKSEPNK